MATSFSQGVPLGFEPAQNGGKDGQPMAMPSAPPGYENVTFDESKSQFLLIVTNVTIIIVRSSAIGSATVHGGGQHCPESIQ